MFETYILQQNYFFVNMAYAQNALAIITKDDTLMLLSENNPDEIRTFSNHNINICGNIHRRNGSIGKKCSLSISNDRTLILAGSKNGCWLFEICNFKNIKVIHGHKKRAVRAVSFSSNNKYFATGGYDLYCKIWSIEKMEEISNFDNHLSDKEPLHIQSISFSPDNLRVASTTEDSCRIWATMSGQEILCIKGQRVCANFSPNGAYIVTTNRLIAKVFDSYNGAELSVFGKHNASITDLCFAPDGNKIASASYDKTCRIWHASNGEEIEVIKFEDTVEKIIWIESGLLCLLSNGRIKFIRADPDDPGRPGRKPTGRADATTRK